MPRIPLKATLTVSSLLACALSACGSQGVSSTLQDVQLFEVRFTVKGEQVNAAAIPLQMESSPVQPEPVIQWTSLNGSGFKDASNVLHVSGTFTLKNASGRAFKNLWVVPINLDDLDQDLNNNATFPTIGPTPYRVPRYFDGTDASEEAYTLTPQRGKLRDGTGSVVEDPQSTPFDSLFSTQVKFIAPAGLKANVYGNHGWTLGPLGAAGEMTVTLGTRRNLPTSPKQNIEGFTLMVGIIEDRR
ncbi:hypothetical protein [Deinococcus cellulosilyticus]|uniref:Lipoprotein n=1 Tax=Deinococcus cellulosilyticus (strain DSM 18568 / NBRC 106333 / KACC 11606 / 5516J-15) TaxID=1223518 RepID=A0A511N9F6_DEIC1|nr:hypothetical protein [Deinococcus cellulosilyticus]GEM49465.1 hypothetical protein DC3_51000 [Deinococcus cellulosilyticus NBRC 106333 = KACC 11606]